MSGNGEMCHCQGKRFLSSLSTGVKHIQDMTLFQPVVIFSRCVALAFAQSAQQAVWESQARWQHWALTYLFSTTKGLF